MKDKKKTKGYFLKKNMIYFLMILPALALSILFHDVPMAGIVLAFKNYTYEGGIWNSEWVGLENFRFFFESDLLFRLLRNTIFYSVAGLLTTNVFCGIFGALMLNEIKKKKNLKLVQTSSLLPNFISVIAVTYIIYLIFNPSVVGIFNTIRNVFGMENIDIYNLPNWWPVILVIVHMWQSAGMAALYNYGALIAIDPCLYESAVIDGATWWQKTRYISMPGMAGMVCMTLITQAGNILNSSLGPYYMTMGSGALLETTDVIASYTYRSIASGSFGASSAIGLFTALVGSVMVITVNLIVKRIDPEKSLF